VDFDTLMSRALERTNALQTYWTVDVTVILGLIAFFSKVCGPKPNRCLLASLATLAFIAFVVANLGALRDVSRQREVIQRHLMEAAQANQKPATCVEMAATIRPASIRAVTMLHIGADIFAVAAIWMLAYFAPTTC
jgi:hypothetical protein